MIQSQVLKQRSKAAQRVAAHALAKQLQAIKLKEVLFLLGFAGGAALLRAAMQPLPSVEPITFFAILSGLLFGARKGFIVGASSLYLSNFLVFGGQGPWTLFQAIGFGAAGVFGSALRKRPTILASLLVGVASTLVFEVVMNLSSVLVFPGSLLAIFLSALPFSLTHLASNSIFSLMIPKAAERAEKLGGFSERELCEEMLSRLAPKKAGASSISGRLLQWLRKSR